MPVLREQDIRVIIDMHFPPGGRYSRGGVLGTAGAEAADAFGNKARFLMMEEPEYRQAFLDTWKRIAARYKDNPVIYGYDLVNEPDQRGPAKFDYWTLQFDAAKAIRAIDPETPVIVESNNWCSPLSYDEFSPMPLKNIIYQIHMYHPGPYTHQGVGDKSYIAEYPRRVLPLTTSKEDLRRTLQPAIDFQNICGGVFRYRLGARCRGISPATHRTLRRVPLGLDLPRLPRMGRVERGTCRCSRKTASLRRQRPQARTAGVLQT